MFKFIYSAKHTLGIATLIASTNFLALAPVSAETIDSIIQFNGEIASTCAFNNSTNGTLDLLGSNVTTTTPGTVEYETNGGAVIMISEPFLSSSPAGYDSQNLSIEASVDDGNGGQAGSPGSGNPSDLTLNAGVGTLNVEVSGSTSDNFLSGSYTVEVTVTCEFNVNPGGAVIIDDPSNG